MFRSSTSPPTVEPTVRGANTWMNFWLWTILKKIVQRPPGKHSLNRWVTVGTARTQNKKFTSSFTAETHRQFLTTNLTTPPKLVHSFSLKDRNHLEKKKNNHEALILSQVPQTLNQPQTKNENTRTPARVRKPGCENIKVNARQMKKTSQIQNRYRIAWHRL